MEAQEPKKPGRPRADEPLTPVTAWIPIGLYDRLDQAATERDMKLSELIRDLLARRLAS